MAFIRSKYRKRDDKVYGPYFHLVENYRKGDKVKQKVIKYLGRNPTFKDIPEEYKEDVRGHPVFVERGFSRNASQNDNHEEESEFLQLNPG